MTKYFNYIVFISLLSIFIVFNINDKISTNIQSILPNSENKEILQEFVKFDLNKKILVAVKGTNRESFKKLQTIEKEFSRINGIKIAKLSKNKKFLEYQKQYQFYIDDIDKKRLENIDVKDALFLLYTNILNSFITPTIDKQDPLSLLKKHKVNLNIKNGKLLLDGYGYLSIFTIDNEQKSLHDYESIYDKIQQVESQYNDVKSFSTIYYFVENSRYIKADASRIVYVATFVLVILYLFLLRNLKLLINTLLTLGISAILSTILLILFYDEISVFVLVFGISISTIAIDYMFHHYFHKSYEEDKGFNKDVFIGFFTTFSVFFIFNFVDFLLIKQIAQFAMISLLSSYLIFAFIYPKITFLQNSFSIKVKNLTFINTKYLFVISILLVVYSVQNLTFNFDVQSLDYDNKELKVKEHFFKERLAKKTQEVFIIKAKNINQLINYNERIRKIDIDMSSSLNSLISKEQFFNKQQELDSLSFGMLKRNIELFSAEMGFKQNTFSSAYNTNEIAPKYTYEMLHEFGIPIQKYKDDYISVVYISKNKIKDILQFDFVYSINMKNIFEKSLQEDVNKMIIYGLFCLVFIIAIIFYHSRTNLLYSLTFLVLPSAFILCYLSFIDVNILHIFMFFILLAISIDYAVYSNNHNIFTRKAILFSALSSFAGFGVLIFSSTSSLYSIGSVASLGIIAILILILFTKVKNES